MNRIFIIPVRVSPAKNSIMPSELKGAYVKCYACGIHYVDAMDRSLKKLLKDGIHPEEVLEPILEVDISRWTEHVAEAWGEFTNHFPSQSEMDAKREEGAVIYSPFYGYERDTG